VWKSCYCLVLSSSLFTESSKQQLVLWLPRRTDDRVSQQRLLVVVVSMERRSVTQQRALCWCCRGGKAWLADKSFSRPPVVSSAAVQAVVATCTSNYNHQYSLPNECADKIPSLASRELEIVKEAAAAAAAPTTNQAWQQLWVSVERVFPHYGCSRTAQDQAVRRSDDAKLSQSCLATFFLLVRWCQIAKDLHLWIATELTDSISILLVFILSLFSQVNSPSKLRSSFALLLCCCL
jgi:hypothetical protein